MRVHPVWYVMLVILALGIGGMAAGSRGKPADVQRERRRKTVSYCLIVSILMGLALYGGAVLVVVGSVIVAGGAIEIGRAASRAHHDRSLRRFQTGAAALYVALSSGFLRLLISGSAESVVFVFLTVFCFDAFSQVTGQLFGRRRLCAPISPNKTMEGFVGGLVAAIAAAWIASHWSPVPPWPASGALIAFSSLAGDLAASYFKRRHGLKDFSGWIPYQGGFLDRFDSLIAAGAAWSAASAVWSGRF